jgi:hypothetical protein
MISRHDFDTIVTLEGTLTYGYAPLGVYERGTTFFTTSY